MSATAVVTTRDGLVFEGTLVTQTTKIVVLSIAGIDTSIEQTQIADIQIKQAPQEIYDATRPGLSDEDVVGRYELALQMYKLEALDLAHVELLSLDRDFPDNPTIQSLLGSVEAQRKLKSERSPQSEGAERDRSRSNRQVSEPRDAVVYLDAEQINLIKVYEVDLEQRPRVTIRPDTLKEFFDLYRDRNGVPRTSSKQRAFRKRPGYEQLELFFEVKARDLYGRVQVRDEPPPLSEFRRLVNPSYVARYLQPHFGQGQISGLTLFSTRPDSVGEAYTNFYLMTQFSSEGVPMIDRANPSRSLMLQWGLPRDQARHPAPDVEGWAPLFRSEEDPQFQRYIEWIESLLDYDPDYGIQYTAIPAAQGADGLDSGDMIPR